MTKTKKARPVKQARRRICFVPGCRRPRPEGRKTCAKHRRQERVLAAA